MEPRPNRRGNHTIRATSSLLIGLQWSHVLTDVETAILLGRGTALEEASMEPRPNRRGNHFYSLYVCYKHHRFNGATS